MSINTNEFPPGLSLEDVASKENIQLSKFDSDIAWKIGTLAKQRAIDYRLSRPILIDITTTDGTTYFHSPSRPSTVKDNDIWVERKRRTVFRFGFSSYYMGQKLKLKDTKNLEEAFYISSIDYAVHGGSVPIRLKNFDGVVAALTISGLKQEEDHAFALQILEEVSKSVE